MNDVNLCSHFDLCGGCSFLDIPYEEQVRTKAERLTEIYGQTVNVTPSPQVWYYRNRMDYVCAWDKIGLREPGNWKAVIDVTDCRLLSETSEEIRNTFREWIHELNIPTYDLKTHEGFLRYITIREAKFTGERMIHLVTKGTEYERFDELVDRLVERFEPAALICSEREERGDDAAGKPYRTIGRDHIIEDFDGKQFIIGSGTFFQTNAWQARNAYREIRNHVPEGARVLDLFCGTGTIGIFCADKASEVVGVELIQSNVDIGQINLKNNNIENMRIVQEKAKNFFKLNEPFDVIIVDPPRSGMGKREIKRIRAATPKRVIYMSCNPETHQRDLQMLCDDEMFTLTHLEAFDFFPHTPHIEGLAVLDWNPAYVPPPEEDAES
jgi:23S rRNA (uracil1939-C5)-methyltransferase